jgi:hypothetical protein
MTVPKYSHISAGKRLPFACRLLAEKSLAVRVQVLLQRLPGNAQTLGNLAYSTR